MQTNLKSDSFCTYNQESAPYFWTFEPGQYYNKYMLGEVGVFTAGGTAGSYVRPDVIDVSSFLSGRGDILAKCNPPVPSLDALQESFTNTPMVQQNQDTSILISKNTREKRSAVDLSAIDYNRQQPILPADPQNLRTIIEDFAAERGGMNTKLYTRASWNPTRKRGNAVDGNKYSCTNVLDPGYYCGDYCGGISGTNIPSNSLSSAYANSHDYPFVGPTSIDIRNVGALSCGPNQFYGPNYDRGSCN